jgi:S1-C subfamily serine protease
MTPQLAEYFGLSKRSGALVVFVYADSAAAKAGLKAGDVILSAAGQTVENPMDLRHALVAKQEGGVELRILRDKQEQTLTVQIEKRSGILLEDGDCIESSV